MRPKVICTVVMSVDGRLMGVGSTTNLLEKFDRHKVHELRDCADAVMVDVGFISSGDPELDLGSSESKRGPYKVIVDSKGLINKDSKALFTEGKKMLVVAKTANHKNLDKLKAIEDLEIITSGEFVVNLDEILDRLYNRGVRSLVVEGSGSLVRRLFNQSFVDELYVTVLPTVLGKGDEVFEKSFDAEIKLDLDGILQYGDHVVLHYLVKA